MEKSKNSDRLLRWYWLLSLFLLLFGAVYEKFSHEVYSYFMLYAFVLPLLGGVLCLTIVKSQGRTIPDSLGRRAYHLGLLTLTMGCILRGILDIYGTSNALLSYFWIAGFCLLFCGIMDIMYRLRIGNH